MQDIISTGFNGKLNDRCGLREITPDAKFSDQVLVGRAVVT
jgi:hypothetical protein